jgi:hypothetical protein
LGVDPIPGDVLGLVEIGDVIPQYVYLRSRQSHAICSVAGGIPRARQHVEIGSILERCIVVPSVPARGVVGIEPVCLVAPSDVVLDEVPDAGLAAAYLEAVAIPR